MENKDGIIRIACSAYSGGVCLFAIADGMGAGGHRVSGRAILAVRQYAKHRLRPSFEDGVTVTEENMLEMITHANASIERHMMRRCIGGGIRNNIRCSDIPE